MKIHELLYPRRCYFCGRLVKEEGPCSRCKENVLELTGEVCRICGALPEDCFCKALRPFAFERNVSAFYYKGGAKTLVLRYKERGKPQLASFMAKRILRQIEGRINLPLSEIAYVPNSKSASFRRGYSPSALLAKELSSLMGIPVADPLVRKATPQQKFQKGNRWKSGHENYALKKGVVVSGNVLLIDDVVTSGASLDACAALLKKAGAQAVYCATFATARGKNRIK